MEKPRTQAFDEEVEESNNLNKPGGAEIDLQQAKWSRNPGEPSNWRTIAVATQYLTRQYGSRQPTG